MHSHHGDKPAIHGMVLFGEGTAYLSYLPMFSSPHNYQAIFEVTLSKEDIDPLATYVGDRHTHPEFKMYSLVPEESFLLTELVTPDSFHSLHPLRTSFLGQIFRGHFEPSHLHEKQGSAVPGLDKVRVQVTNVVLFRQLDTYAQAPPLLPQLEYFLFGKAQEHFLAHVITHPPDFDQILGVWIDDHQFKDNEVGRGLLVSFPSRENSEAQKVEEQEQIAGQVWFPGQSSSKSLSVKFHIETRFYYETDDLASAGHPTSS